jgi:hypothetical protein
MDKGSVKLAPSILAADFAHWESRSLKRSVAALIEFMLTSWMDILCPTLRWARRWSNR